MSSMKKFCRQQGARKLAACELMQPAQGAGRPSSRLLQALRLRSATHTNIIYATSNTHI